MKEKMILTGLIDEHKADFILDALDEDQETEVWICSRGGEVGAALAIHDAFRRHGNVTAIATGECQSAALLAFLGAKHRMATPNTIFLNHAVVGEGGEQWPEACAIPAIDEMRRWACGSFGAEEALKRAVIEAILEPASPKSGYGAASGEKPAGPEGPALQAETARPAAYIHGRAPGPVYE